MSLARKFVTLVLATFLAGSLGCKEKRPKPSLPGPATAPTLSESLPPELTQTEAPEPVAAVKPPPEPPKAVTKPRTHARKVKPSTPPPAASAADNAAPPASANTTVAAIKPPRNPAEAATEAAISADVSSAQALREKNTTQQVLDDTENQLKNVEARKLSSDEQAILSQIKTYISQSRKAITDGDYERASNLAKKAQLLAEALVKK